MTSFRCLLPIVFALLSTLAWSVRGAEPEVLFLEFHTKDNADAGISRVKELFEASGIKWNTVALTDFEAQKVSAQTGRILLIQESESFPVSAVNGLETYLKSGGSVLFVGEDRPFTAPAVYHEDRMVTQKTYFEKLKTDPRGKDTGIVRQGKAYRLQSSDASAGAANSAVFADDGKTLRFHVARHSHWETWAVPVEPGAIPADTEFLRVRVKGDVPYIALELRENDNSRWIAVFEVKKEWETCFIPVDAFRVWDSPQRNRPGDRVRFENVRQASIGLADSHVRGLTTDASYNFELQRIDALSKANDSSGNVYPTNFSLEGIAPCYKSYQLDGPVTIISGDHRFNYPGAIISPVPRMTGLGITMERPWRFIPVATARNEAGGRGYPAWIMLNIDRQYKDAVVSGMGFSLDTILKEQELSALLIDLVKRIGNEAFLAGGGVSDFVIDAGTPFRFGAEPFRDGVGMKVRASIQNADGTVVAEFEKPVVGRNPVVAETTLNAPGVYICTVELKDAQNRVVDKIESEIIIDDGNPDPPSAFVRIEKDNFIIDGKPWYPNGVNFWPVYSVAGMDVNDYRTGWGNRRFYDPALVEEAILDAKSAGINMLSIQSGKDVLRDILYRCKKHGMKLNLFVGSANPMAFREDALRQLIEDARLRDNAALFSYDIAWEPTNSMYNAAGRERYRPEWNRWLTVQYGSKENAVQDWKFNPGANARGLLAPPTDEQFRADGTHRVYVAAYRRFMDDHTAQLWQQAADKLRLIDPNHLISNRAGNIHPYDNAFTGTVKALDFISPEGYSISSGVKGEAAIGFATRVIDFYSGGKPVLWSEYGKSVSSPDFQPDATELKQQAEYNAMYYRRGLEAGAQGFAPWWWPGGYRVNEMSDFGISNIDGTLRPSAEIAKQFADQIQTPRNRRAGTVPFDFDPDENAGGYPGLVFGKGGEVYLDAASKGEMLLFRTEAMGKTSVDVPLKGLGNVPSTGRNPVKYLNGFYEKVEYRNASGQWIGILDSTTIPHNGPLELRVRIANMGEVPFIATSGTGGIAVHVTHDEQVLRFPIPSDLPRLRDVTVTGIVIPGDWRGTLSFRLEAKDRAVFGNEFRLTVAE